MKEEEIVLWEKVFEADLEHIASELKRTIVAPSLILLEGIVGSGKTSFSKNFINDGETFSPSYSVLTQTQEVLHGDFYRLKSAEEILYLELPLYLEGKKYFLLEWGRQFYEEILKELPEHFRVYTLEITVNESSEKHSRNYQLCEVFEN